MQGQQYLQRLAYPGVVVHHEYFPVRLCHRQPAVFRRFKSRKDNHFFLTRPQTRAAYSSCSESTGLAEAAFQLCSVTVSTVTAATARNETAKIHTGTGAW